MYFLDIVIQMIYGYSFESGLFVDQEASKCHMCRNNIGLNISIGMNLLYNSVMREY